MAGEEEKDNAEALRAQRIRRELQDPGAKPDLGHPATVFGDW